MVPQIGSKHTSLLLASLQIDAWKLLLSVPRVADVFPVDQVLAGVDWQTRKGNKRRRRTIVRIVDVDTARIGVPSWEDRIVVG